MNYINFFLRIVYMCDRVLMCMGHNEGFQEGSPFTMGSGEGLGHQP